MLYTLGIGSTTWKKIKCPIGFTIDIFREAIYANGTLNWSFSVIDHVNGLIRQPLVMALNLASEECRMITGPDVTLTRYSYWLRELGGYLTLGHTPLNKRNTVTMWMLKDYDKQGWVKQCTFQIPYGPCSGSSVLPIRNDIMLFQSKEYQSHYVCHYDKCHKLFKEIKVYGLPPPVTGFVNFHVESLSFVYQQNPVPLVLIVAF
ncbi:hypothetical protein IFM89_022939 [Coptis chinensis]|uniref:F-box associated beta-propeller type 3 domain-containing protein n=1 Tax=Coptis chinensis TaxID=261450 RepID=A0A835HLF5_9MAGN|nr:hypothetical protein IFM89_022939 [Coptis chinensis]